MPPGCGCAHTGTMTAYFHPRLQQGRLVAGNRLRLALRHWPQSVFHLLAAAALIAIAAAALGRIDGDRIGLIIRLLLQQPLVVALAFAAFGFAMCRSASLDLQQELRLGWWGAMPVPAQATRRSLRLHAAVQTLFANVVVGAVLLGIVALSRRSTEWLLPLWTTASGGLCAGALLGYASARRQRREARQKTSRETAHSSAAWLPLRGLDHPQLHNIPEWQRRETVRRWRSGGRAWQLGALALLVPMGMPLLPLLGLSLLGVSLVWFGLALRASENTLVSAQQLCAALPLPFARFAAATLRYPLFACTSTALCGAAGLLLQSARWPIALGYVVALGLGTALSLSLTWRYRRRPLSARLRATAESALLLALAVQFAPLAVLLALGLIVRHYQVAKRS